MRKVRPVGRPPRREGDKIPVTVKFTADELHPVDAQIAAGRGDDRSDVIRGAVEQAAVKWLGQWAVDQDFDTLMASALQDNRTWRPDGHKDGYYRVMLLAAGTCLTPTAEQHFQKTIELLDNPRGLTQAVWVSPGQVGFIANVPRLYSDGDGIIAARFSALLSLTNLSESNPFKVELARQVFCIDRWSSDPVARNYQPPNPNAPRPGIAMSDDETRLRTIAEQLVAQNVPYAWGGGNLDGPTLGTRDGGLADNFRDYEKIGFDGDGLSRYMIWQAFNVEIPRDSRYLYQWGTSVDRPEPGDLVFPAVVLDAFANYNVVYLGDQQVIAVGRSGQTVRLEPLIATARTRFVRVLPNR